jgi:hypothetical protein
MDTVGLGQIGILKPFIAVGAKSTQVSGGIVSSLGLVLDVPDGEP